jgi:threonine/homoserine/homoserine lactone efflux protein
MDPILLAKGAVAGFIIAAPVGPVGILCAQRTLTLGIVSGLVAGIGAGVADTVFGAIAAFGLTFIEAFLLRNQDIMRLAGGLLLLVLGVHGLMKKVDVHVSRRSQLLQARNTARGHTGDVIVTFTLTITNPVTILSFSPVFLAVDAVVKEGDRPAAFTLIAGVFAGSMIWWAMLCGLTSLMRRRLNQDRMRIIQRVSAGIIVVLGVLVLLSLTPLGQRLIKQMAETSILG